MDTFMVSAILCTLLFLVLAKLFVCIWVYKDAKQRGLNAVLWVVVVLLVDVFLGMLVYLLVGRKQKRIFCEKCKSNIIGNATFCSECGTPVTLKEEKSYKGLLIFSVVCILISFLSIGMLIFSYTTANGFRFEKEYSFKKIGVNSYATNISQISSDNMWELSFDNTSKGYTLSKTYNAKIEPKSISIEANNNNDGQVRLMLIQDEKVIDEMIGTGTFEFDMSEFEIGKIDVKIQNVDATMFTAKIEVEE